MPGVLTVATVNVNGVRAAVRRGMPTWLAQRAPDVLCLQEVRASDDDLAAALGSGWHTVHEEASAKGRAGVAVTTRTPPRGGAGRSRSRDARSVRRGRPLGRGRPDAGDRTLTVISAYVHTGEAGTPARSRRSSPSSRPAPPASPPSPAEAGTLLPSRGISTSPTARRTSRTGRGTWKKSGFLPQERAWFYRPLADGGFVDVAPALSGEGPGPYSWWSWRGKAFDLDSGWRIDYQVASAGLAALAVKADDRSRAQLRRALERPCPRRGRVRPRPHPLHPVIKEMSDAVRSGSAHAERPTFP